MSVYLLYFLFLKGMRETGVIGYGWIMSLLLLYKSAKTATLVFIKQKQDFEAHLVCRHPDNLDMSLDCAWFQEKRAHCVL